MDQRVEYVSYVEEKGGTATKGLEYAILSMHQEGVQA
jgi:hypothetical protein